MIFIALTFANVKQATLLIGKGKNFNHHFKIERHQAKIRKKCLLFQNISKIKMLVKREYPPTQKLITKPLKTSVATIKQTKI